MKITPRRGADPDLERFWNGTFKEHFDAVVTSDGATITVSLEQSGGGDLTLQFSDGLTLFDCTPAQTITLTAGTTASPQNNWVYVLKSNKTLTQSTVGWPAEEHARIAFFYVQSASDVQAHGALINQNWNDGLKDGNNTGHVTHLGSWIRRDGARWFKGVDGEGSDGIIDIQASGTEMYLKLGSGQISQMHLHNFASKDTSVTDYVHVANHPTTPFVAIQDIGTILVDSTGASLSGKYYNLVFGAVANKGGEYAPLMMKLPSGSYGNVNDAINDVDGYTDLSMPREFSKESSTGFLLYQVTVKHATGTNTFTVHNEIDIREVSALTATGTGTGGTITEFSDSQFKVFDNVDATKIIVFEADQITTGNTRTITMADEDIDLGDFGLNTTHRLGDGSDHSDVALNTTHRTSTGADHSYIDQSVVSGATPTFGDIKGETKCWDFTIIDPNAVYDTDTQIFVAVAKSDMTITKLQVSCDVSTLNVAGDLKKATAFIGFGTPVVINDFDTTSGVRVDTSITAGSVSAGEIIYLQFDSAPNSSLTQIHFHIEWDID